MHLVTDTRTKFGTIPRRSTPASEDGLLRRVMTVVSKLVGGEWAGSGTNSVKHMRVLEALPIGPKKQLLLITCDGERFLVGSGPDSVDTIVRVQPADTPLQASQDTRR